MADELSDLFSTDRSERMRRGRGDLFTGASPLGNAADIHNAKWHSQLLIANNPYASTARKRFISNMVGKGFNVQWDNPELQDMWTEFADKPMADGSGNLLGCLMQLAGDLFSEGEFFARLVTPKVWDVVPLAIEIIPPSLCPLFHTNKVKKLIMGIRYGAFSRPDTYYFHQPGYSVIRAPLYDRKLTAISAENILHQYISSSSSQRRGMPILAASLLTLYQVDELTSATLTKQKAAQAVGWVVTKRDSGSLPSIGALQQPTDPLKAKEEERLPIQQVKAGGVHYLNADEQIQHVDIKDIGSSMMDLLVAQLRVVSVAAFTTYEEMTGDLSEVNFSSIRAGLISARRLIEQHQQLHLIWGFLQPLLDKFLTRINLLRSGKFKGATYTVTSPKWLWVDQLGDAKADVLEIEAGIKTLEIALAERGLTLEQYAASRERSDAVTEKYPTKASQEAAAVNEPEEEEETSSPKDEPKPSEKKKQKKTNEDK